MTPKEKAEELVNKYLLTTPVGFHIDDAKKCAIIAVDLILDEIFWEDSVQWDEVKEYYKEVKKEIEKS